MQRRKRRRKKMSEMRLFIARHGETDFNKKGLLQGRGIDAPLNETGRKQAEAISEYLKQYNVSYLVSSSLKRSWQTALPVEDRTELETLKMKDLDEMHFGKFEGVPYMEASAELNELHNAWESGDVLKQIPEGESPQEVFDRANGAVEHLIEKYRDGSMILILHGRLIRILLSSWLGYGLNNMHKIDHQNGALYQIVYNGTFNPVYLNKTDHLQLIPD
jgi:broad specificity phosphatase PhoE